MKTILFFEPEISGHQLDYIEHMCIYYKGISLPFRIIFIVNNCFYNTLKERGKEKLFDIFHNSGICFIEIKEKELKQCSSSYLPKAAIFKWFIAKKYALKNNVDHIHFMFFDHLQLPLALKLNIRCNFTISGLLFRLALNYQKDSDTLVVKIRRFIKKILHQSMLNNRQVRTVFSLDPFFEEYAMNNFNNGLKVKALPDPSLFENKYTMYKDNLIDFSDPGRKMFVMFGYMQKRKGILQLLHSLKYLDNTITSKLFIYIVGEIDESIKNEVINVEAEIRKINNNIKLIIWDQYVSDRELVSLINSSDCILAPYQYFTGSSGVIFWAAGAGKPIITQDIGLLGKWTKEYQLGVATDTTKSSKIAGAILKVITSGNEQLCDSKKMREFSNNHTPEKFAEIIHNNIGI